jgi:hypothetical protein
MSTTASPVTHTADVEINNPVIGLGHVPLVTEIGKVSNKAPTVITARKPKHIVLAGVTCASIKYRAFTILEEIVELLLSSKKIPVGAGLD